jgi:hypothetical protein
MGETWFRVPETLKITLTGNLQKGVYAKDLSLWIIGMIGSSGADYTTVKAALDAGFKRLLLITSITETANLTLLDGTYIMGIDKDIIWNLDTYTITTTNAHDYYFSNLIEHLICLLQANLMPKLLI